MQQIKDLFLLDSSIHFLNHGSFGACPRPVFEVYQEWQRELERQPVAFLGRRAESLLAEARTCLAQFVGVRPEDLVFFPNPTTAGNMIMRSLLSVGARQKGVALAPGDEILTSNHEYGALDRTWRYFCLQSGAIYIQRPIALPLESAEAFVEHFWSGVNERTRVIYLSHITSPTALIFPVQEICRRARQAGILSIIDGAHAPGQIALDLDKVGADLYFAACHKWLMAPKGAAFLYAHQDVQHWLDPLVVSWGYESAVPSISQFIEYHEWQGTRDLAAYLSVPAAIRFQEEHVWDAVRDRCHHLAAQARRRISSLTNLPAICPETSHWFAQMFSVLLPAAVDLSELKRRLYEEFCVEAPVMEWNGQKFLRVSIQGYNDQSDVDALVDALQHLLTG
jgi:isopenicillin-N epimerase